MTRRRHGPGRGCRGPASATTRHRGRPRVYGEGRIELAKRAGQRRGWVTGTFPLYGKAVAKRYKAFEATWRPAGGAIRVVLVGDPRGWPAFFCTDPAAGVADILGLVADRFSMGTCFRDVKEVVGAGRQQVRHVWASVGSFHVRLWTYTLTEAWAWGGARGSLWPPECLAWDGGQRRPGHADKRRAWRRELLGEEIDAVLRDGTDGEEIRDLAERLLNLAA